MYKDRIRKWGLAKNIRGKEMKAIIRKQGERSRAGKKSVFCLRDIHVPGNKIDRYQRLVRMCSEEEAWAIRESTPPGIDCYTPLATPLRTPECLEIPERIAKHVQDYVYSCLDSQNWIVTKDQSCINARNLEDNTTDFRIECTHAALLLGRRQRHIAWQILDMAVALVEQIVLAETPATLKSVAATILTVFLPNQLIDINTMVLKQLSAMSAAIKHGAHPFNQIFPRLLDLETSHLNYTLCIAQQSQLDCFLNRLGPFNWLTLDLQLSIMPMNIKPERTIKWYLTLLEKCEVAFGASDPRCLDVAFFCATSYYDHCEFENAAKLARSIIEHAEKHPEYLISIITEAFYTLSIAQFELFETEQAENNILEAISRRVSALGPEDDRALFYMSVFEHRLEKLDKSNEAAALHTAIHATTESKYARFKILEETRYATYTRSMLKCKYWEDVMKDNKASAAGLIPGSLSCQNENTIQAIENHFPHERKVVW